MIDDALESFSAALTANPVASLYGVGMTMTWLRIVRELRDAGLSWEDAVCICIPSSIATVGFVQGFDFVHDELAPEVVARWNQRDVVERSVRDGATAFRALLEDEKAEDEDERLLGVAMYATMLQTIPEGGRAVREQGQDALGYTLAILAAVEVEPDEQGFPVRFRGHGEAHGDTAMSLAIPRLYLESKAAKSGEEGTCTSR
jgi:hypothetical protein